MICDFCHENEAAIFLEQTLPGGSRRKINICMDCALERGISSSSRLVESTVISLFKELALEAKKIEQINSKMCPVCGMSLGSIKKTLKTGCPECYAIFKDEIKQLLSDKGYKAPYTGNMPARIPSVRSVLNDRIILKNKLDAALKKEDYEKAALYRDYLKALEKTAVSSGSGE